MVHNRYRVVFTSHATGLATIMTVMALSISGATAIAALHGVVKTVQPLL